MGRINITVFTIMYCTYGHLTILLKRFNSYFVFFKSMIVHKMVPDMKHSISTTVMSFKKLYEKHKLDKKIV